MKLYWKLLLRNFRVRNIFGSYNILEGTYTKQGMEFDQNYNGNLQIGLKDTIRSQHFNYINFVKASDNFSRISFWYENMDLTRMSNGLTLIGKVKKVRNQRISNQFLYFFVIETSATGDNREIILTHEQVASNIEFINKLNRVDNNRSPQQTKGKVSDVKHATKNAETEIIRAFTNLEPCIYQNLIRFRMTDKSYHVVLMQNYYNNYIQPINKCLGFSFGKLNLREIYGPSYENRNSKSIVVQELSEKISSKRDKYSFVYGIVCRVDKETNSHSNQHSSFLSNRGQVLVTAISDTLKSRYDSIGKSQIFIKYNFHQQNELLGHLIPGYMYMFTDVQLILQDSLKMYYKMSNFKKSDIVKLSQTPYNCNMDDLTQRMQISPLRVYYEHFIDRNIRKFRVTKYNTEIITGKFICASRQCKRNRVITDVNSAFGFNHPDRYNFECECGCKESELVLWGLVVVFDDDHFAMLSMETNELISFFDLSHEHLTTIKESLLKQGKVGKDLTSNLYYLKRKTPTYLPGLESVQSHITHTYFEKIVVGTSYVDIKKTMRQSLSEQEMISIEMSYRPQKEELKKKSIFPNGVMLKKQTKLVSMPSVKVTHVSDWYKH